MRIKPSVTYEPGELKITLPESNPAFLHCNLLKGLVNYSKTTTKKMNDDEIDGHLALMKLLESLLPNEKLLQQSFK